MRRSSLFFFRHIAGLAALAALSALSGNANAKNARIETDDLLRRPAFRTLTVGSCPIGREEPADARYSCSCARLIYPDYPKIPWLNRLIAQSIVLPMFAGVLDERAPEPFSRAKGQALKIRYKSKLKTLIYPGDGRAPKGTEKLPLTDFTAILAGHDPNNRSPAGQPRPELFGPYLQLSMTYTLGREYDAYSSGPMGSFIVIDTRTRKALSFSDLILPGQEQALEALQRNAFRAYLGTERAMPDEAIEAYLADASFTFRSSKNWRIAAGGLLFHFNAYEIGPRAFGTPEIFVAKTELQNIIRPEILARIP